MTPEKRKLIEKCLIRDIEIKMLEAKEDGQIISEDIMKEILKNLEDSPLKTINEVK